MLKYKTEKVIQVQDWDKLVRDTYGKPYRFQQQDGCQSRKIVHITIPEEKQWIKNMEEEMNDSVPYVINGDEMGVKFDVWLKRDPTEWKGEKGEERYLELFWGRNFYPNINTVANDLYEKGLIEAGDYTINIDW